MSAPKRLYFAPSELASSDQHGTDMNDKEMDVYYWLTAWSGPANPVVSRCQYVNVSQLWHDGNEEPKEEGPYLLEITFTLDDGESGCAFITSYWGKYGWTEDFMPNGATDIRVERWLYVVELM